MPPAAVHGSSSRRWAAFFDTDEAIVPRGPLVHSWRAALQQAAGISPTVMTREDEQPAQHAAHVALENPFKVAYCFKNLDVCPCEWLADLFSDDRAAAWRALLWSVRQPCSHVLQPPGLC